MKHTKKQKAVFLLEEIGGVDDRFLSEALTYRRKRAVPIRFLSLAACLVAALVISIPLLLQAFQTLQGIDPSQGTQPEADSIASLDALLEQTVQGGAYVPLSSYEEVEYFSAPYLAWQEEGSDAVYLSRALTQSEVERILSLIGKGTPVGASAPESIFRVYLVMGDGMVLTPYLPSTDGNLYSSTLFDYQAELLPSRELVCCISDILD